MYVNCKFDRVTLAFIYACESILLVLMLMWAFFIFKALHQVAVRGYNQHRMSTLNIRIQLRNKGFPIVFFIVCIVLLALLRLNTCSSYIEAWLTLLPMMIVMSAVSAVACFIYMPKDPEEDAVLQVWLQTFAWSERGLQRKLTARDALTAQRCQLHNVPMFCFETAIKLFHWSALVYRSNEEESVDNSAKTLDRAMKASHLEHFELLVEKAEDTRVLLAWGQSSLILSFRGTSSWTNVKADLSAWLRGYPPGKGWGTSIIGTRPAVHSGFLRSWQANGLDQRVLQRVRDILDEPGTSRKRVYVTGHSLGGALATLAAFDIASAHADLPVTCYTFGGPRTGNHHFAKEYERRVPDTFHVINGQDVVTRGGKFGVYKRCGARVLLLPRGDLLVWPSYAETSLWQVPFGASGRDHLLKSYRESLLSVMLNQFDRNKRFKDGMQGVLELLEGVRILHTDRHSQRVMHRRSSREEELMDRLAELAEAQGADATVGRTLSLQLEEAAPGELRILEPDEDQPPQGGTAAGAEQPAGAAAGKAVQQGDAAEQGPNPFDAALAAAEEGGAPAAASGSEQGSAASSARPVPQAASRQAAVRPSLRVLGRTVSVPERRASSFAVDRMGSTASIGGSVCSSGTFSRRDLCR